MASTISFAHANSGFQAGIIYGQVHTEFHSPPEPPETPPRPSAHLPFARDLDFVERGGLLDQIHQKCAVPGSRTALIGLGGVGKSQLAIEYGYQVEKQSPRTWIFWIHAGSTARLEQSYRDIADYVKVRGRRDPKANILKLVHNWLCDGKNKPWLLILDNIDNTHYFPEASNADQGVQGTGVNGGILQLMSIYLPQSQNGSILITSRRSLYSALLTSRGGCRWVSEGLTAIACGEGKRRTSSSQRDNVDEQKRALHKTALVYNTPATDPFVVILPVTCPFQNLLQLGCLARIVLCATFLSESSPGAAAFVAASKKADLEFGMRDVQILVFLALVPFSRREWFVEDSPALWCLNLVSATTW